MRIRCRPPVPARNHGDGRNYPLPSGELIEQRLSLVTLGVADIRRARQFYEQLGWRGQQVEETVFFQAGSIGIVLWGRDKLAQDSGVDDPGTDGFGGIALAHNVRSPADVDATVALGADAGATITRPPSETFYGGTRDASPIPTDTCGRSHTTRGSLLTAMVRSSSPTSVPRPDGRRGPHLTRRLTSVEYGAQAAPRGTGDRKLFATPVDRNHTKPQRCKPGVISSVWAAGRSTGCPHRP